MIDARKTDQELVRAAQHHDHQALNDLLQRHQARIYAVCRRLTGNDSDALDATQETMMAVIRGLASFDGRSAFSTWCYRIATNTCIDEFRRQSRRPITVGLDLDDGPHHRGSDLQDPVSQVIERDTVDAALNELPEEFRAVVILRDLLGFDYAEIAEILDLAPGTVRSRIARGRARLVDLLYENDAATGNQPPPSERHTSES